MPEKSDPRELAALDAIIAFNLAGRAPEDLSDEEILASCELCPELSEEARKLLKQLGPTPFSDRREKPASAEVQSEHREFAGMYRQGSDEDIDPKLKAEIERKRDEIRARLRAKRNKDV